MIAEAALRKIFIDDASVTALVVARIYPMGNVPQGATLPYGSYMRASTEPQTSMTGGQTVAKARIQVDWIASTYDGVRDLATKARLAADGYRGDVTIGAETMSIKHCSLEMEIDDPETASPGAEFRGFRIVQDYTVMHLQTAGN